MTKKEEPMSTQLAQGTVIEGPEAQTKTLVRREPVPKELAALGVTVAVDPDSEMQILIIPKELRQRANVLTPVQAFQQADPNWRPSLRVVELDPSKDGAHFYPQTGGKLAPRKQGLELLADAAGVVSVRTMLSGRERVVVGDVTAETFTHAAILKIRKSDGTLRTLEASRTYEPFAEYEEIVTAVGSGQYAKKPGAADHAAEVRKRWLNEIKFAKAKNESKAILRAIRAALQIPHTVTPAEAAKPWVVVGWNLSPQDTPEVRAAIAQLYGGEPERAIEMHQDWGGYELEEAVIEDDATEASSREPAASPPPEAAEPSGAQGSSVDAQASPAIGDSPSSPEGGREPDEQGPGSARPEPAPAPNLSEPTIPGLEPEAEVGPSGLTKEELAEVSAFGKTKPPFGTYQNFTIAKVFAVGEAADEWLAYALRGTSPEDTEFRRLLVLACRVHRPALYEAWRAEG